MNSRLLYISILWMVSFWTACNTNDSDQVINSQGLFEFSDILDSSDFADVPEYLNPDKVLCNGKGLKVARCISNELKTGKCLGIIKEGKRVYVIEIDCDEMKESPNDSLIISNH